MVERNGPVDTASNLEHGMYLIGSDYVIVNNVIVGNAAYGITVAGNEYRPENYAGEEYAGAENWLIANNTIGSQVNRTGIVLWKSLTKNITIQNNLFFDNAGEEAIEFLNSGGGHIFRNNIYNEPDLTDGDGALYMDSGNIRAEPGAVDPAGGDFHLALDSVGIDAGVGVDEGAPDRDLERRARPLGNAVDVGAYESCPR